MLLDKQKFLKEYFEQQRRSKEIILCLMGETGFKNINFSIDTEIIIIDETPKIKVTIQQKPTIYITSDTTQDIDEQDFKVMEVTNFRNEQSDF